MPPCLRLRRSRTVSRSSAASSAPGSASRPSAYRRSSAGEVVRLDGQRAPALGERVEGAVDAGHRIQRAGAGGEQRGDPAAVDVIGLGRGGLGGAERGAAERFLVAQALAPPEQLGLLGLVRRGVLDLGELELEQVELTVARAGALAQLVEPRLEITGAGVDGGERVAPRQLAGAAEAVEDGELGRGEHEPAVLVLAVEGDELAADVAQVVHRRGASAEVGAGAPLGAHAPRDHELLGVGRDAVAELLADGVAELEDALDVGLPRSRPDDPRLRAAAEQQVERVREHGLARARSRRSAR